MVSSWRWICRRPLKPFRIFNKLPYTGIDFERVGAGIRVG
jgi:hypothetical protein